MPKKDKDRECTCTEKRGKLFTCDYCKDEEVQDYDDLFEDDDPQKDKEKRKDTDGKMYTRKQFIKMYKGRESGLRAWTAAKPAETSTRYFAEGTDDVPVEGTPELSAIIRACSEETERGKLCKLTEGLCGAVSKHYVHARCKEQLLRDAGLLVKGEEMAMEVEDDAADDELCTLKPEQAKPKSMGGCPRCDFLRVKLHQGAGPPDPAAERFN